MKPDRSAPAQLSGVVALLLTMLLLSGCDTSPVSRLYKNTSVGKAAPRVIAVNYPLASGVKLLGDDLVNLIYPVPADVDPAYWTPDEATVLEMQRVDLLFLNGAGHESWENQVTLSPLNRAVTSLGFRDEWIKLDETTTHQHGPEGEHTHSATAFTVWLDPNLYEEQLRVIARGLQRAVDQSASPAQQMEIEDRFNNAVDRLHGFNKRWDVASVKLMTAPVIASHPVYQYLASRYGWRLKSVHWEPEQTPTEEQWAEFDAMLEDHPAEMMIWEAEPNAETKQQLESRNIRVVVIRPLGNGDPKNNILDDMEQNVAAFEQAVAELTGSPAKSTAEE